MSHHFLLGGHPDLERLTMVGMCSLQQWLSEKLRVEKDRSLTKCWFVDTSLQHQPCNNSRLYLSDLDSILKTSTGKRVRLVWARLPRAPSILCPQTKSIRPLQHPIGRSTRGAYSFCTPIACSCSRQRVTTWTRSYSLGTWAAKKERRRWRSDLRLLKQ